MNRTGPNRYLGGLRAALLCATVFAVPPAYAQQQPGTAAAPSGTPTPATAPGIQDIVVTARKKAENLRDVPVAVAAISGAQLASKNVLHIRDLASVTPNVFFSQGSLQPMSFIRGFGSGTNIGFAQSVAKFTDNVSFSRDQDGRLPIFDVQRVEVLKGPQVLTFGDSATVGALNIATKKPGSTFEADGTASYEFAEDQAVLQGGVTTPLADWASLRVAGLYDDLSRGQLYNVLKDQREPQSRNWAIRPTLRLTPTDRLEIMLHGEYHHVRVYGSDVQAIAQPLKVGAPLFPEVDDKNQRDVDYSGAPIAAQEVTAMNARLLQADINYKIFGGTLTSTTAWRRTHSNAQFGIDGINYAQSYWNDLNEKYRQFSEEIRFTGTYGRLDFTLGGFYQNDMMNADILQYFELGGLGYAGAAATPFGRVTLFDQRTKTYSGFGDLTYHITHRLSLSAGVRYSDYQKEIGQELFGVPIIPGTNFDTTRQQLVSAETPYYDAVEAAILGTATHQFPFGSLGLKESHWQPQAILQYKFDARNMIFAKFAKGAKVGGFDYSWGSVTPVTKAGSIMFGPEHASSVEIGMKGLIFDNKLEYALDLFRTTYTALQASSYVNFANLIRNVGKARSQGVELDLTYAATPDLRIDFNGSYLDAKYVNYPNAPCSSIQNATGCTSQDVSGQPTPFASHWTGNFSIDYQHMLTNNYVMTFGASVFARSEYNAGAYNDPRMEAHGFAQLDAHIDLKKDGGAWTASIFSRNLTNVRNLEFAVLVPGQSSAIAGTYARGRQVGLRLGFNLM